MINYFAYPGLRISHVNDADLYSKIVEVCMGDYINYDQKIRKNYLVEKRQYALWLGWKFTNLSSIALGKCFNKDHSTVIYSIKKINNFLNIKDKKTITDLNEIVGKLIQAGCYLRGEHLAGCSEAVPPVLQFPAVVFDCKN